MEVIWKYKWSRSTTIFFLTWDIQTISPHKYSNATGHGNCGINIPRDIAIYKEHNQDNILIVVSLSTNDVDEVMPNLDPSPLLCSRGDPTNLKI